MNSMPLGQERTEPPRSVIDLMVTVPLLPEWLPASVGTFSPHPEEKWALRKSIDLNGSVWIVARAHF